MGCYAHTLRAKNLTLNAAAKLIGVDKSSLSRMIERLLQKGWVSRQDGPDRRSLSLELTTEGRKLVPILAKLADENDKLFFGTLSAEKQDKLLATIKRLLKANEMIEIFQLMAGTV